MPEKEKPPAMRVDDYLLLYEKVPSPNQEEGTNMTFLFDSFITSYVSLKLEVQ